jgi:hypothetical protein
LPKGIPGIGEEMDGATQHAPHPDRQFISATLGNGAISASRR